MIKPTVFSSGCAALSAPIPRRFFEGLLQELSSLFFWVFTVSVNVCAAPCVVQCLTNKQAIHGMARLPEKLSRRVYTFLRRGKKEPICGRAVLFSHVPRSPLLSRSFFPFDSVSLFTHWPFLTHTVFCEPVLFGLGSCMWSLVRWSFWRRLLKPGRKISRGWRVGSIVSLEEKLKAKPFKDCCV